MAMLDSDAELLSDEDTQHPQEVADVPGSPTRVLSDLRHKNEVMQLHGEMDRDEGIGNILGETRSRHSVVSLGILPHR
eukprot:gene11026-19638_t